MLDITQQKFWNNFAKVSWEKKSRIEKNFKSPLSEIKEDQIFSMLVEYSDYCRKVKNPEGFKLFLDGQRQHDEDILQILPVKKDKSFAGYHERMNKIFPDYCLVCDELLQVSQVNWGKLQRFTHDLFSHVGFPNRFVEMGLYLGNYRKTPFGVHIDGCSVFSFPVVGQKTFRLWTPEFVAKNPSLDRAHRYEKFKKNSQVLTAFPGDMTYWPSSAWHIAESDGSFSATWSLGVWVDRPHKNNVEDAIRPLIEKKLGQLGEDKVSPLAALENDGHTSFLPENYLQTISVLKNITELELHDCFLRSWLKQRSTDGFKTAPRMKPAGKLTLKSHITMSGAQPILWSKLKSESKQIYAFQGELYEAARSTHFLKLIKDLNLGKTCLISDYLIGKHKLQEFKLVQSLLNAGALKVISGQKLK